MKIFTPSKSDEVGESQRHGGVKNTDAYKIGASNDHTIEIKDSHVWLDGLWIQNSGSDKHAVYLYNVDRASETKISNCIIDGDNTTGVGQTRYGIGTYKIPKYSTIKVWNCVICDFEDGNKNGKGFRNYDDDLAAYLYNNTIVNTKYGMVADKGDNIAKNNVALCTFGFSGVEWNTDPQEPAHCSHNASSDGNAVGTPSYTLSSSDATAYFKANNDFHILYGTYADEILDKGVDLSSDVFIPVSFDLDHHSRAAGTPDLGADEKTVRATYYFLGSSGSELSVYNENGEREYSNLYGKGLVGRTISDPGEDDSEKEYFYLKDHLGSIRATVSENVSTATLDVVAAYDYYPYGKQIRLDVEEDARQAFTGKEYDEEGTENGAPGIRQYYFGARYYDPETAAWTTRDKEGQFFNPYSYSRNPILMVDKDGNLFGLVIGVSFAVGYVRTGLRTKKWGADAIKGGLWTAAGYASAFYAPWASAGVLAAGQGVATSFANRKGLFAEQFAAGMLEGTLDWANIGTMGLLGEQIGGISGEIRGRAFNRAFDIAGEEASLNIAEAKEMNERFAAYPGQGSFVKWGTDFQWGGTGYTSDWAKFTHQRYLMARHKRLRLTDMDAAMDLHRRYSFNLMHYEEGEAWRSDSQKDYGFWGAITQFGHALAGQFSSHEVIFFGFETYGEPHVPYEREDEWDDYGLANWLRGYEHP